MPVTDEQVATLHAQLAGRREEHRRLLGELDREAAQTGYNALVTAAFSVAVVKRFPKDTTPAMVIEFVGDIRSASDNAARQDARTLERVLLAATSDQDISDIDPRIRFQARVVLLAGMIHDLQLDPDGLDRFMREARTLADKLLA